MNSTQYSNYDLERQRQRLETLVQPSTKPLSPVVAALQTLGRQLVNFLTAQPGLRIRQRLHQGYPVWYVYDPVINQTKRFYSEEELRTWLDGRYYE